MKAYLPRWALWIMLPVLAVVWGVVTWVTFVAPGGREDPGLAAWLGITAVLILIAIMLWLMGTGRLPAYIIEMDDKDESSER
jgi:hypothetical protein